MIAESLHMKNIYDSLYIASRSTSRCINRVMVSLEGKSAKIRHKQGKKTKRARKKIVLRVVGYTYIVLQYRILGIS